MLNFWSLLMLLHKSPRVQQNVLDCAGLLSVWSVLLLSLHCLCVGVSLSVLLFFISHCKSGFVWGNKPVSGRFQCKSFTPTSSVNSPVSANTYG